MSEPNYAYCATYCPGKIIGCPHYTPKEPFQVCKTYKIINDLAPKNKMRMSRDRLEKMVEAARRGR
jgi:hypothetical protein